MMNSSPTPQLTLHVASIRRIARALSIDAAEADDVTQEVLVAALEGSEQAKDLPAWLAGAARNFARSRNRGEARRRGREEEASRAEAQASAAERAAQLEVAEQLLARVRDLSDAQAEVVWLRFWEDMPPRDIAKKLGIGVDTVKTRLKRGLSTLRDELDADTPGGREAWLGSMARLWIDTSGRAVPLTSAAAGLLPTLLMIKKAIFPVAAAAILVGILIVQASEPNPDSLPAATAPETDTELAANTEEETLEDGAVTPVNTEEDEQRTVAATNGSLEVRVVREFDGAPLSGVVVSVIEHGRPESVGRRASSDTDGYLQFEDMDAGRVTLVSDRGAEMTIERTEGRQAVQLGIPLGVRVTGTVVDPSGAPVADAEVLLQQNHMVGEWTDVTTVATTDAAGRFDLIDVDPGACMGARASGFAPSNLEELEHIDLAGGDDLDLTLELEEGGGFVWAIVQDRDGNPVPGAMVWVVERRPWRNTPDGSFSTPGGRVVHSAIDGMIRVDGLGTNSARIVVDAEGFGLESTSTPVQRGEGAPTKIVLSPPSAIEGVVLGPDGRGIQNVGVRLLRSGWSTSQDFDPFDFPDTRTDANGAFTFERMTDGPYELVAFVKGRPNLEAEGRLGVGERKKIELRAPGGDLLTGRAVALDGTPLHREIVMVTGPDGWKSDCSTKEDGTFRIEGAPEGPLTLHFYPVSQGFSFPAVTMTDVKPEDSPIEIVWEGAGKVGDVRGDFVDTAKWGDEGDRIDVQIRQSHVFSRDLELEDKRFEFKDVPAGKDYRVTVSSRTRVLWSSELFEVVEGRTTDLGSIETEAPATVRVALEGEGSERVVAELRNEALGWRIPMENVDGVLSSDRVPAGSWAMNLSSWGQETAAAHDVVHFNLRAGQELSTTYALVTVPVTYLKFEPEFRPHHREVFVHTSDGVLQSAQTMVGSSSKGHPVALVPGDYTIEIIATREGRTGRAQFTISDGAAAEALTLPIEITED